METESYIVCVILYLWFLKEKLPRLTGTIPWVVYVTIAVNEIGFFLYWSSCYIAVVWWKTYPIVAIPLVVLGWWLRILIYSMRGLM